MTSGFAARFARLSLRSSRNFPQRARYIALAGAAIAVLAKALNSMSTVLPSAASGMRTRSK